MPTIYVLRHGQASFGQADYDVLSPTGELQSKLLGEELRRRGLRPDQVWSGTLRRQRATAAACLAVAEFDVPCREDPRWNEYDHLGLVQERMLESGLPQSPVEFQRLLEDALHAWISSGTDGDGTWRNFCDSACAALAELFADLGRGGTALVFTSGGIIAAIATQVLGLPPEGFLAINRVTVNAGITKLVHGRSGTTLVSLNEHGHFEGQHRELLSYR